MRIGKLVIAGGILAMLVALSACSKNQGASDASANASDDKAKATDSASGKSGTEAASHKRPSQDPVYPVVDIETSLGTIRVKLDAVKANLTVDNFLSYVESQYYDGTIFHQVSRDYVILGGGYTPDMVEKKPTSPAVRNQADNGLKNVRGTIAMARPADVIDGAKAQFFINVADNPSLDQQSADPSHPEAYGYCVFGKVEQGMEVADRIANVPVHDVQDFPDVPTQVVEIKSIRRVQ